jgi:hypothetical protein
MKYFHLSHSKIIKLLNTALHADGYQVRTRDPQTLDRLGELNELWRGIFKYVKTKSWWVGDMTASEYGSKKPVISLQNIASQEKQK